MRPYNKALKPWARDLRCNQTAAEALLWSKLRRKQVLGLQFYRQKPLANFSVDFYCASAKMVIELDGSQHYEPDHQERDQMRDAALAAMGLLVLRFDNLQILKETQAVMEVVFEVAAQRNA